MYDYCFTFRSVTLAQRGTRTLSKAGVWNTMVRTPKHLQQQGCGYCLRVHEAQLALARELLRQEEIRYHKLYIKQPDDSWQEVTE